LFNKESRKIIKIIASFAGLIGCYIFGTLWYVLLYIKNGDTMSFISALTICVLPFIIPDILKILISVTISEKTKKLIIKN
jgi:biotin transport system substrate-specific component